MSRAAALGEARGFGSRKDFRANRAAERNLAPQSSLFCLSESSMAQMKDQHAMVSRKVMLILKVVTNYSRARGLDKFSTGTGFGAV